MGAAARIRPDEYLFVQVRGDLGEGEPCPCRKPHPTC
jgi:hypothetical protein